MYQLKKGQEKFTVVEGHFKGKTFAPGVPYAEIPGEYAGRFTAIKAAPAPEPPAEPAKPKSDKKASA
jgi:hypothetical protein